MSTPHPWLFCALAGIAYALSVSNLIEGFPWGALAWVALVPLHLALRGASAGQAFARGWLAGCVAFVGTMYWVVVAVHRYGHVPLAVSIAIMLLLAAYLGLYIGVYAWGVRYLESRRTPAVWLLAPCLWVTLEYARAHALTGLPWGLLGYSQFRWLPVIQIAGVTGVYGVSFLVVLVNAVVSTFLRRAMVQSAPRASAPSTPAAATPSTRAAFPSTRAAFRQSRIPLTAAAVLVLAVCLYGWGQLEIPAADRLAVGIAQANIDQARKWDAAHRSETLDRYERLTQAVAGDAGLILWPEAAAPFVFERASPDRARIVTIAKDARTPLVFGSPALRRHADGTVSPLNSAFVLTRDGAVSGRYDKHHLVPFGEYIPLKPALAFLDKLVAGIGDFQPGRNPAPLAVSLGRDGPQVRFGVAICYEVIFPDLVRRLAADGANFLVTITNDAWFGRTVAPHQHFAMVVFRAVENRLAFARAANTGVSGLIDPTGRILAATPLFTEQAVTGTIPLGAPSTPYTRFGDVFARICVILTALAVALARFRGRGGGLRRRDMKKDNATEGWIPDY